MYSPRRRLKRTILSTILLVVATWTQGPIVGISTALAADPSADIPGIDMPGTIAAGRLGGAIYDVVYRLSVAPGFVIVASLTGAAGTDFDLYLFDSSATTVLSDTGLLKKSTGPTSTESLSWPSRSGGVYYIDLNGATNVEGDYRLTVQTVPDPTPPIVSAVLAGGRGSTNQLTGPVSLIASDDLSGVSEMAFSGDGSVYTDWLPFAPATTWTFDPGDGTKTLWVKVKNGVGLESIPATATTMLDTIQPTPISIVPSGPSVVGLRPTFRITFDEPMDAATWADQGLIVQSSSGDLVSGQYSYSPVDRIGSFLPTVALSAGTTYVVTIGDVRDIAGNRVLSNGSWAITPLAAAELDAFARPATLIFGATSTLRVVLSGAPVPASVQVEKRSSNTGGFVPVSTLAVVDGQASATVKPEVNTTYRFRYAGAFGVSSAQLDVPILVRRSIGLVGRSSSTVSRAKVGSTVTLVAAAGPAAAGVSVSFRLYHYDATRRAWVYAGSRGRSTNTAGRAVVAWVTTAAGSWYWRASVGSTVDFANNVSPVYRWTVSR